MSRSCAVALLALLSAGCGTAVQFGGTVYRGEWTSYRVGPLPDWHRIASSDSQLAFQCRGMGVIVSFKENESTRTSQGGRRP